MVRTKKFLLKPWLVKVWSKKVSLRTIERETKRKTKRQRITRIINEAGIIATLVLLTNNLSDLPNDLWGRINMAFSALNSLFWTKP